MEENRKAIKFMSNKSKIEIIKKLKKLMAHERSARMMGNEGDNFKHWIEELRTRHNITQEIKLDAETEAHAFDDYGGEPIFAPDSKLFKKRRIFWEEVLTHNLCVYFGCRTIVFGKNNLKVVVGEKNDRAKVIKSFLHLHETAIEGYAEFIEPRRHTLSLKEKRLKRESFLHGFSYGIQQRLEQFKAAEAELNQIEKHHGVRPARLDGQTNALVRKESIEVREKREELNHELDQMPTQREPTFTEIDEQGFFAGFTTGASCAITDEISLPAKQAFDDLQEVRDVVRKKREEELRVQNYGLHWWKYSGTSSTSTTTFSGVQRSLIFED